MSGWVIAAIVFVIVFALYLLFMHGASSGRPEWYQQELDDIQMHNVGKKKQDEQK